MQSGVGQNDSIAIVDRVLVVPAAAEGGSLLGQPGGLVLLHLRLVVVVVVVVIAVILVVGAGRQLELVAERRQA